jgi:hypothetical protein
MAAIINRLMPMEYIIAAAHFRSVRREICVDSLSRNDTQLFPALMAGEH